MAARVRTIVVALLFVSPLSNGLVTAQSLPAPPQLTAPVNDFANAIDENAKQQLDRRIRSLKAASGDVVVVATVRTFQPYADIDA